MNEWNRVKLPLSEEDRKHGVTEKGYEYTARKTLVRGYVILDPNHQGPFHEVEIKIPDDFSKRKEAANGS